MRIHETTLRRYIRTLLEADGLETTAAEIAAKAAVTPVSTAPQSTTTTPGQSEGDMPPEEVDALAKRMREKGAPESSVKDMLAAAMGQQ